MQALKFVGDYRKVMASSIAEAHARSLDPGPRSWGLGLGAPLTVAEPARAMGEALVIGGRAAILPTSPMTAVWTKPPFTSAFLVFWSPDGALGFYNPQSTEWTIGGILEQILTEMLASANDSGIYGIIMSGKLLSLAGQALVKSPLDCFMPQDGGLINTPENYPHFIRRARDSYGQHPFIAAGVVHDPSRINLKKGGVLAEPAFGLLPGAAGLHFHVHAAVYNRDSEVYDQNCEGVDHIVANADAASRELVTVEHVLPATRIYEAWCFVTPLNAIEEFR